MLDKIRKITFRQIMAFSAILVTTVFCARAGAEYMAEKSARADGSLQQTVYSLSDFEPGSLVWKDGYIISTDADPQLIMSGPVKLTGIRFYMESMYSPGDIVVYYMLEDDGAFTEKKRIWAYPAEDRENWYEIDLPLTEVTALRIDPTVYAGNRLHFGEFIFNEEKTFGDYFDISAGTVFYFGIYTAFLGAVLKFIQELLTKNAK